MDALDTTWALEMGCGDMNLKKIPPLAEIRPDDPKIIKTIKKVLTIQHRYNLCPIFVLIIIVMLMLIILLLLFSEKSVEVVLFYYVIICFIIGISYGLIACAIFVYEYNRKYKKG
jgi:hypothetical protein